jgi:hypothetical protein
MKQIPLPNPFDAGDVPDDLRPHLSITVDGEKVEKCFEVYLGENGYALCYTGEWDESGNLGTIIHDGLVELWYTNEKVEVSYE